jgi:protein-disulfide isomerase
MEEKKSLFTPVLAGLLVVAAFFVGSLYTRVQMLEKGTSDKKVDGKAVVAGNNGEKEQGAEITLGDVPEITDQDYIRGSKDAPILLVEYSDYECPFCSRFHPTVKQIVEEYGNKVAWVYRHFPLSFHASAQKFAEGAECAGELGGNDGFWKFSDALYERVAAGGMDASKLEALATELGFNGTSFTQCLNSGKYAEKISNQMSAGQSAGVEGTPGTFILTKDGGKELIPGALPYEEVKKMVDKYVK